MSSTSGVPLRRASTSSRPDIYAVDRFDETCAEFSRGGNPLFIPETPGDAGGAARAFYAIGKYRAIGYSPFGFDGGGIMLDASQQDRSYARAYRVLRALAPRHCRPQDLRPHDQCRAP